jgi:G:T-mismatch repair DNA endonuclease (very short patch repair protein)
MLSPLHSKDTAGDEICLWHINHREPAARDQLHQAALRKLGWRVIVIWECEVESAKALERLALRITQSGKNSTRFK